MCYWSFREKKQNIAEMLLFYVRMLLFYVEYNSSNIPKFWLHEPPLMPKICFLPTDKIFVSHNLKMTHNLSWKKNILISMQYGKIFSHIIVHAPIEYHTLYCSIGKLLWIPN